ncbi:putative CBL-interacting protein kinase 13 [Hordeum vulgare]|nr:putative CBL-interacting protein kinase 13 [Hordeum vulgare]
MVADKEDAITQLGNARLVISDLRKQIEKKNLANKADTNIHQVLRAIAEKERDEEKKEKVKLVEEMDKIKQERGMLLEEREKLKQEKSYLEYTIGDLFKEKEATKGKIRKIKEIGDG